jgi:hypothetical protein
MVLHPSIFEFDCIDRNNFVRATGGDIWVHEGGCSLLKLPCRKQPVHSDRWEEF